MKFSEPGPIQHETLPDSMLEQIKAIHRAIGGVLTNITLEQFEVAFMRDRNPGAELKLWKTLVKTFERARLLFPDDLETRKAIMQIIMGIQTASFDRKELERPDVKLVLMTLLEVKMEEL